MRTCQVCEKQFNQIGAGRPRKTCSVKCKYKLDNINAKARRERFERQCVICATVFETARKSQVCCSKECTDKRQRIVAYEKWREHQATRPSHKVSQCSWCNEELLIPSNFSGVTKYHEACKKPARQAQYRVKSIKRQGVTNGNLLSHDEVAQRDGFICYLCETAVDMSLPRTSRYGATLDHVIPLNKGGADTLDNVRLAHWICNIRKSDKTLEEYRAESR